MLSFASNPDSDAVGEIIVFSGSDVPPWLLQETWLSEASLTKMVMYVWYNMTPKLLFIHKITKTVMHVWCNINPSYLSFSKNSSPVCGWRFGLAPEPEARFKFV